MSYEATTCKTSYSSLSCRFSVLILLAAGLCFEGAFGSWCAVSCSAVVGEVDDDLDRELDLNAMRAAPLRAVIHGGG